MFRGWIVVFAAFCASSTLGLTLSFTDFFLPLAKSFHLSSVTDSTIPSISALVLALASPVGGYLVSAYGFRKICYVGTILFGGATFLSAFVSGYLELLVTYGIIMSFGCAFLLTSGTSIVVKWFVQRRGLAVGIMASGTAVGSLLIPGVSELLIIWDGWRSAFAAVGLSYLAVLLLVSYFMQTPDDLSIKPYGSGVVVAGLDKRRATIDYTPRRALLTARFWAIFAMFSLGSIGVSMFYVHAVPFGFSHHITEQTASLSIIFLGVGSLFSRIIMGVVSDKMRLGGTLIIDFVLETIGLAGLTFVGSSSLALYLCGITLGFAYGGFMTEFVSLTGTLFGMKWMQKIWPFCALAYGVGGFVGPLIGGIYFQEFGNYSNIFLVAAIPAAVALSISIAFAKIPVQQITSKKVNE